MGGKVRPGYWKDLYRDRKPERRASQKRSMAKKPEHYAGYQADYYRAHWAGEALQRARRRAKLEGCECSLTLATMPVLPAICPVLGIDLLVGRGDKPGPTPNSPSLDRFNPTLGYVPGNVFVISFKANTIKSNATALELEMVLRYMQSIGNSSAS